jgi:hypothetical protein
MSGRCGCRSSAFDDDQVLFGRVPLEEDISTLQMTSSCSDDI